MSYCTIDDLKKLIPEDMLIQLTDDENTGAVATNRVEEAIGQADAEIDSYLAGEYAVPLNPVPEIARKCSVDMAAYNLYSRRVEEIPETRSERYRNAVALLINIARGTAFVTAVPEPGPAAAGGRIKSTRTPEDRVVSPSSIRGF
jgi:phage gp36-like protein